MELSECFGQEVASHFAIELSEAERAVVARRLQILTARELEVVLAVCEGGSNDAIGERLCVSVATVRTHLTRAHSKLGTSRKSDLVRLALGTLVESYRAAAAGRVVEAKVGNGSALRTAS